MSEAEHFFGAGVEWTGAIPGRDADVIGLGVFHVRFSERLGLDESSETAAELYYNAQITPFFSIQPDIQYIANPGGSDSDDALVLGLRTTLRF